MEAFIIVPSIRERLKSLNVAKAIKLVVHRGGTKTFVWY